MFWDCKLEEEEVVVYVALQNTRDGKYWQIVLFDTTFRPLRPRHCAIV